MTTTLDALNAQGRAMVASRSTLELCDMYTLTKTQQSASSGDDARAASRILGWVAEELEKRDPAAADRWWEAEESIEIDMLARDEWIDGASNLTPHPFFGCGTDL